MVKSVIIYFLFCNLFFSYNINKINNIFLHNTKVSNKGYDERYTNKDLDPLLLTKIKGHFVKKKLHSHY